MPFSNIRITSPLGVVRYFQPAQLSEVCLRLCGGLTEKQTLDALLLQAELRDKRVAKHKVKGEWLIDERLVPLHVTGNSLYFDEGSVSYIQPGEDE